MQEGAEQRKLWIVLGDIHEEIERFASIPELAGAEGVIVTGDITQDGGPEAAARVMDVIKARNTRIFAQIGNMDRAGVNTWLDEQRWNLHARMLPLQEDVALIGVGASVPTPFNTPSEFSEEQYAAWLDAAWQEARRYPRVVLVSHNPPRDTVCDAIGNGMHVGSTAVRAFIESAQPDICLCGHIHEARGVDAIGRTVVLNPGNFGAGGYAVLERRGDALTARLCQLPAREGV